MRNNHTHAPCQSTGRVGGILLGGILIATSHYTVCATWRCHLRAAFAVGDPNQPTCSRDEYAPTTSPVWGYSRECMAVWQYYMFWSSGASNGRRV